MYDFVFTEVLQSYEYVSYEKFGLFLIEIAFIAKMVS